MKLYILISGDVDGSYSPRYVLDPTVIERLEFLADNDEIDWESGLGVDGDGFHYDTINVPDGSTEESLGLYDVIDHARLDSEIDSLDKETF